MSEASADSCDRTETVRLQVDPRIASEVAAILREAGPGPECVSAVVDLRTSADLAFDVAKPAAEENPIPLPDVWIPDSSLWLARGRRSEDGARRLTEQPQSIARSPVVIAMRRQTAEDLGWPEKQQSWSSLVAQELSGMKAAVTDPRRDAAGLVSALNQQPTEAASSTAPSPELLRFTRSVTVPLLRGQSPTAAVRLKSVDAISTSERDVIAANVEEPAQPLVAQYDVNNMRFLDFPYIPLADATTGTLPAAKRRAADVVRKRLLSAKGQKRLAAAGFRVGKNRLSLPSAQAVGVLDVSVPERAAPTDDVVQKLQDQWAQLGRRARVLVLMDESGSMADPLSGGPGGQSKMALARQAFAASVKEVAPDSEMGLWTFTASPRRDFRVEVPLGPVNGAVGERSRRAALATAVAGLRPVDGGGTGLYDTTLDAFRSASADYRFGRLNAIFVFTDGRNADDPGSISEATLLDTLKKEFNPAQPVRILTFAYGKDADRATLSRISRLTGGSSYNAVRPEQVGPLLTKALAEL